MWDMTEPRPFFPQMSVGLSSAFRLAFWRNFDASETLEVEPCQYLPGRSQPLRAVFSPFFFRTEVGFCA